MGPRERPVWAVGQARLCLVGGFALIMDSRPVSVPAVSQRLLALLALSARGVQRLHASARLWPDSPDERAAAGLRSALWRLRQILPGIVGSVGDQLILDPELEVDLHRLSAEAIRLRSGGGFREVGPNVVADFQGDLLPHWYEDWVLVERERYRQLRLHALERLCQLFIEGGRPADAVDAGLAAVEGEPLRETAQRALISAYLAEGNRAEAMRQYERYRRLLQRELGLEPGVELNTLLAQAGRS